MKREEADPFSKSSFINSVSLHFSDCAKLSEKQLMFFTGEPIRYLALLRLCTMASMNGPPFFSGWVAQSFQTG
jgi:hypothetical protein